MTATLLPSNPAGRGRGHTGGDDTPLSVSGTRPSHLRTIEVIGMLSFQALTGGNALAPWGSVATTRSQLCSRCASPPSVVMLGLVFCGSCFESLSGVLRMRLTGEEMMRLLRGETLSQHARQIVVMVLSSIVGADSERLKKVLR